jgi:hypothetical protein
MNKRYSSTSSAKLGQYNKEGARVNHFQYCKAKDETDVVVNGTGMDVKEGCSESE